MIYFDNAATSFPKPASVYEGCAFALRELGANPGRSGHSLSMKTAEMIFRTREAVAHFFNAHEIEHVVFTANCTTSINMVLKGILKKGDHVVISDLEHNALVRPLETLKQRGIVSYSIAHVVEGDDKKTLQNFKDAIRSNTVLVACTHASNVFGIRLPITGIGNICRQKNIMFLVDAAQSAGIVSIDMQRDNIDFLCVAPHKGLYAPMGTGILIASRADLLRSFCEGGTGSNSLELLQPQDMPDKFESGTVNVPGIVGIYYGIQSVQRIGLHTISNHEFSLVQQIYRRLSQISHIRLYTTFPTHHTHLPVLSFNLRKQGSEETVAQLSDKGFALRGGLHCAPVAHISRGTQQIGTARLCPSMFTTRQEAEMLCKAIENL